MGTMETGKRDKFGNMHYESSEIATMEKVCGQELRLAWRWAVLVAESLVHRANTE